MTGLDARRATLLAAILGLSVTILDETVVFLALPSIERDLNIGLTGQQWVINGYLLSLSSLLLLTGSLADLFGRRRLFEIGLAGFALTSLACALAPSGAALIAFRLLQGAAAAVLMPSTLAMLTAAFQGDDRGAAIGSWAAWGGVAAAVGPLVAGVLIEALSWRWIFVLSLPIAAAAFALSRWKVQESYGQAGTLRDVDLLGALFGALALGGLSYALIQGPQAGWSDPTVIAALVLALGGAAAFAVTENRVRAPMLPFGLFRSRNFSAANAATLCLYGIFNGAFFILTIYLQTSLGYSPLRAGLATLPVTILVITLASRFGRLGERIGPRLPMTFGMALTGVGLGLLAALRPGEGYLAHVLPGVVIFGFGLALTVPSLTTTAVSAAGDERAGTASGVNDEVSRIAALIAVAVFGLIFATTFRDSLKPPPATQAAPVTALVQRARAHPTAAPDLPLPPSLRPQLGPQIRKASVDGYRAAMSAGVIGALLGAAISWAGIRTQSAAASRPDPAAPQAPDHGENAPA